VIKEVDGVTTVFHYDFNGNIIAKSDENGNFTVEYLYNGKGRVALVDVGTGEMYYFLNDRFGTPQMLTDASNTVVWEGIYKPFGEATVNPNSSVVNNFRFPGQYYDQETGLHYNWHRYYDPGTGRYLRADPIGLAGGINLFLYANGNPINLIDAEGLDFFDDYNKNLKGTSRFFFKGVTSLSRTGLGLITSGSFARTMGTVTPVQAVRSLFQTPAGIATLGGVSGTLVAAGAHVVGNTAAGAAFLFGGAGFGSIVSSIPVYDVDKTIGNWWGDLAWDFIHGNNEDILCE